MRRLSRGRSGKPAARLCFPSSCSAGAGSIMCIHSKSSLVAGAAWRRSPKVSDQQRSLLADRMHFVWETGPLSRPLSFMGLRAMPIMSLRSAGLRSCRGKYIAVGCLEDMHTPARSIPTRTGGQSLNAGTSTERGTLGREVAPPAHTPIRAGPDAALFPRPPEPHAP